MSHVAAAPARRETVRNTLIDALLITLGVVSCTLNAFHGSVWYDESCTAAMIRHPFGEIWRLTAASDANPPLYYLMLKGVTLLFGSDLPVLRLFSSLGVFSLLLLGIGPVRRLFGRRTSILFCLLVICAPVMIYAAMDIRMYSWAMLFVTGSALSAQAVLEGGGRREWLAFTGYSIAGAYTHYYALLGIILIGLYVAGFLLFSRQRCLTSCSLVLIVAVTAYLPWAGNLMGQIAAVSQQFWIQPPTARNLAGGYLLFPLRGTIDGVYTLPLLAVVLAAALPGYLKLYRASSQAGGSSLYLAVYLLTIITGVTVSWLFRPVLVHRYLIPVAGLLFVSLAHAISTNGSRKARTCCIICLVATAVAGNAAVFRQAYRDENTAAVRLIAQQLADDDLFLHSHFATVGIYSFYFPRHRHYLCRNEGSAASASLAPFSPGAAEVSSTSCVADTGQGVWLINPRDEWLGTIRGERLGSDGRFSRPYAPYGRHSDRIVRVLPDPPR